MARKRLAVDSVYTLWVENFTEIAPSCNVSNVHVFLHFMQDFKMATKKQQERDFWKKCQMTA